MLGDKRNREYVQHQINTQIARYLGSLKTNDKTRACLYCGTVFKLFRRNRYYCNSKCSRAAHYLKFKIRNAVD